MSIESKTESELFTIVSNETISSIMIPDAMAIYLYLLSSPDIETRNFKHIRKRFSMGRISLEKAMKHLTDLGLISYQVTRKANGRFNGIINLVEWEVRKPVSNEVDCLTEKV